MRNKVIVHIIPAIKIGGVEKLIFSSVVDINITHDYRVLVVGEVDKTLWKTLPEEIKCYIDVPSSSNWIIGVFEAIRKLKRIKPEIVITSLWKSALVVFLIPKFTFTHIGFIHNSRWYHFADKLFLNWQIKKADLLFADSNATSSFISSINSRAKVEIIPLIFPSTVEKGKLMDNSVFRFCYIGRLHPVKGIERTLELIKLLQLKKVDFKFDFYGNDEGELEKIKGFISNNPLIKVSYKGAIMPWNVRTILGTYHFFVLLSKFEGMAMSVVEAMQSGVVPVVTNVGEICNYASNLVNAVVLNHDEDLSKVVQVIKIIEDNKEIYTKLSANAVGTFIKYDSYINKMTSLIETL